MQLYAYFLQRKVKIVLRMLLEVGFCFVLIVIVFYEFYKWATVDNDYFAKKKLKYLKPKFLFGNTIGLFLKRYRPADFFNSMYYQYPKEKLIGFFDMREPVYLVRDPDLICQITIKDFVHFEDHTAFIEGESDSLFGQTLFLLSSGKWREMRSNLSPAFTSSKMRNMFELIIECTNDITKYLAEQDTQNKSIRWEMKDLFSRYVSDIISSCAFGLKVDSLQDRTNEFFTIGMDSVNLDSLKAGLRMLIVRTFPRLTRAIDFEFFPTHVREFFRAMVLGTMAEREKRQIFRPDMIHILMQLRSGKFQQQNEETHEDDDNTGFATAEESNIGEFQAKRSWTDDEIIAQCFMFCLAGLDTTPTVMSFLSYELAINPDIQQKLYEEIRVVNESLNGSRLNYNTLSKLKYMDQVISETLRKYPILFTNRKCTKDYEFKLDGNKILIERGKQLWIPIYSIQHDSQYYEDPEKFDPERFNDDNKHKIKPGSYIPFGMGPRNCIGLRFALMGIKALYFHLLLNFSIQPYDKTQIPIKFIKSPVSLASENGINLELKPRALL